MFYEPSLSRLKNLNISNNGYITLIFKEIDYNEIYDTNLKKVINYDFFCRFSVNDKIIIGYNPKHVINTDEEPSKKIRENFKKKFYRVEDIKYPIFIGGYLGYYGYENISSIEESVKSNYNNPTNIPINIFCLYDSFIEIDYKIKINELN